MAAATAPETSLREILTTEEEIEAILGKPAPRALTKVVDSLDDICLAFIARSPFILVASSDAAGRVATLAAGQVDAALLTTPSFFRLIDDGAFTNLAYISEFPDIFVSTVYLFRKSYVAQNPTVAESLIKAHAEAIKRFYDDKIMAIKAYSSHIRGETPVDTARVYDIYRKDSLLDRVPFVLKGAIASGVERDGDANPQLKTFDFSKLVDNSVVLKLVREGWFEKLYGPSVKAEQDRKLKEAFGV